jgi:hypothetical protein
MAFPRIPSVLLALLLSAPLAQAAPGKPIIGQDRTDWPAVYAAARGQAVTGDRQSQTK